MRCPRCSGPLPAGFPGATVTCACGAATTIAAPLGRAAGAGPYRGAATLPAAAPEVRCPFCGAVCPPGSRVCPSCDVRFDSVRCASCYTLQPPGSFSCARCGRALELEPLLDATDAPCPRCRRPLEVAGGATHGLSECPRCGGMFVPRDELADILCRAEAGGAFPEPARAQARALDTVTYLPCPLCHASMNRVNFGKVSGVIVDVCREHGTWFDSGELTRVVVFAADGGLDKTRAREAEERRREKKKIGAEAAMLRGELAAEDAKDRLNEWGLLLRDLFLW